MCVDPFDICISNRQWEYSIFILRNIVRGRLQAQGLQAADDFPPFEGRKKRTPTWSKRNEKKNANMQSYEDQEEDYENWAEYLTENLNEALQTKDIGLPITRLTKPIKLSKLYRVLSTPWTQQGTQ